MTVPVLPQLSAEQRAELEAWENRSLSSAEFSARVDAPWTDAEREDFVNLVRWFLRRYPTVRERLQAQREREARWRHNQLV